MAGDITELLVAHRQGSPEALGELIPLVYGDLRRMARARRRRAPTGETLDTGALVHEAYLRLVDERRAGWQDRNHFFAVAATAMRQIVIDHARRRASAKRGSAAPVTTLGGVNVEDPVRIDAVALLDLDRRPTASAS